MSVTVKRLRELLARLPDDARVSAYEGEGIGLVIEFPGRRKPAWIEAYPGRQADNYIEGFDLEKGSEGIPYREREDLNEDD